MDRAYLAAINTDGTLAAWNPGANNTVLTLAVSGTTIYAGGHFTQLCTDAAGTCTNPGLPVARNYLAAINSNGTLAATLGEMIDAPDSSVFALAIGADGAPYVGGAFTRWGAQTGGGAALAAAGGAVDRSFPQVVGEVYATAPDGVGGWYIGGGFSAVGGVPRSNLAHITSSGEVDPNWNPGANERVQALVVSGSTVYASGYFRQLCTDAAGTCTDPGTPVDRAFLAAINTDGTLAAWNPGADNAVMALAVSGSTVYAGGYFTMAGGGSFGDTTRISLAAFDASGNLTTWNPGTNGYVNALAVSGSTVYVGGAFTQLCTDAAGSCSSPGTPVDRAYLAAINTDGTLAAWNPGANQFVSALAVSGSTVYAGGAFTALCTDPAGTCTNPGTPVDRAYLAEINSDGTLADWNPGANNLVTTLGVFGSTVYAGGYFSMAGGGSYGDTTRNHLAAFDASGNLTAWNPGANGAVNALAVSGSTVYAGGQFTIAGLVPRAFLAAINTDGTLAAWNPGATGQVNALAVSGSTVYAGGAFSQLCTDPAGTCSSPGTGVDRYFLAAINSDGTLADWNPGANSQVNALAVSGSTVYAGGAFTMAGGGSFGDTTRNYLAAFDASGALTTWNPNANNQVRTLAANNSKLIAGGSFTQIGGTANGVTTAQYLALLPLSSLPNAPTNVQVTRGNTSGIATWTAPTDTGGSPITGYVLEIAPGPNYDSWSTATTSGNCLTLTCTVTGLTNGARYQVRVRGVNANGPGATSLASQWFQPQAPTANPAVPTGLSATPGNTTLSVTWNPVVDFGAGATTITQYMAYVFTGTTLLKTCRVTGAPAPTACQVTGLANGSSYTIKVRAWNNIGKFSDLSAAAGPYTPIP